MNSLTHENGLPSIGGIDASTAIKLGFPSTIKQNTGWDQFSFSQDISENPYTHFDKKVIMDVGAGFSELLSIIEKNSTPKALIAVDPIYSDISSASKYTRDQINGFISLLMKAEEKRSNKNISWIQEMRSNSERQLHEMNQFENQFKNQSSRILRYDEIPTDKMVDYVFFMSTLYSNILDPRDLLESVKKILQPDGQIIIIDFIDKRGNQVFDTINNAGIPILGTHNQYFCAKLNKGDIEKLEWRNPPQIS